MTDPDLRRDGSGMRGMVAAACLACCAVPILAVLGGLSLAGLASTLLVGTGGLIVAVVAAAAFIVVQRRCVRACAAAGPEPVPVELTVAPSRGDTSRMR